MRDKGQRRRAAARPPKGAPGPLGDEVAHRPGDLLDRHSLVDAMLVEEVDMVDAEPFQRSLRHRADGGGLSGPVRPGSLR